MSVSGPNAKSGEVRCTAAIGGKADVTRTSSNRREWPGPSHHSRPNCQV